MNLNLVSLVTGTVSPELITFVQYFIYVRS